MLLWLLQNTVLAALLAVGVAVVCRVARPNPAVRHILWLVVLVRLLMPPGLHWPWTLPDPFNRRDASSAIAPSVAEASEQVLVPGVVESETFVAVVEPAE